MAANTISHVSHPRYEEENHLVIRAAAELKPERTALVSAPRFVKWLGVLSTGLIGAATLAPQVFGIPTDLQPWVFVIFIFWFLAFCAGMFDL